MRNKLIGSLGLFVIIVLAWSLRIWGIYWDSGYHFHPDERMIIMVADKIKWVNPITDWESFTSINSDLNPKFFAYGSLPIYLLALGSNISGWFLKNTQVPTYDGMLIVGRLMSALFDTLTTLIVYLIGRKIKNRKLGLLSAFLYAVAVFPIQTSHFFAVDTLLNLLVSSLFLLAISIKKINAKAAIWAGVLLGLAIGTKASGVIGGLFWGIWLIWKTFKVNNLDLNKKSTYFVILVNLFKWGLITATVAMVTLSIVQPYMWYDHLQFWSDLSNQSRMRYDAWTFPYTRQYIGTTPYLYNLEQIIKYGLGWGQSLLILIGLVAIFKITINKEYTKNNYKDLYWVLMLIAVFVLPFGMYSVKFMRYLLPIYPMLTVVGAFGFIYWSNKFTGIKKKIVVLSLIGSLGITLGWTIGFMSTYSQKNTRISASIWMWQQLKPGSTLAIEHWDDAIPVPPWHGKFNQITLALYEYDDEKKWREISNQLVDADEIVIASNRLYSPLMRLVEKYPIASKYYNQLFSGNLGFELAFVATNYPKLGTWEMNDDKADESFHVYDHPKIMIFRKKTEYTAEQYYDLITKDKL